MSDQISKEVVQKDGGFTVLKDIQVAPDHRPEQPSIMTLH